MTVPVGAGRCSCTPPSLKRTPSASSAETTRCRARALALGTLPLDPSHAARQGREIEARSASSCCERPVRLRAARNMPSVISTIVMLGLFARRQQDSDSHPPFLPAGGLPFAPDPISKKKKEIRFLEFLWFPFLLDCLDASRTEQRARSRTMMRCKAMHNL